MSRRKNQKVVKMKRRNSHVLGLFLFVFAAYIIILFIQSFTKEHVSIYEVNQKQIADNENLRGIILRKETLVTAKQDGYLNYYVGEGSKLAASTTVYSLSQEEKVVDAVASVDTNEVKLSEDDTRNIRSTIADFREDFDMSDYQQLVSFRYNMENTLLELSNVNLAENLNKIKKETGDSSDFQLVKAEETGIISFSTDGMENMTIDSLKKSDFKEMTDQWQQLRSKTVKKGAPVYRVVTDEKWSLVVSLTREQYKKLLKKDMVLVKIKKDNMELMPVVRTFTSDGGYYANLLFDKYMIHYLNNRYLDVEIQFNNADGLKIPNSSIIQKQCYVIPQDYIARGSAKSDKEGITCITYKENGEEQLEFVPAEIYYKDEEGNVYIDAKLVKAGTTILKKDDPGSRMQLTDIKKIDGVYNCNQGYSRFRYVNKLYENQEYAIIENGNTYSLSNFDHIILNPDMIGEDEVIY